MGDRGASEQWVPFVYRDFYDLPRMLVFMAAGRCYLFDCSFDEGVDDYLPDYQVFELPFESLSDDASTRRCFSRSVRSPGGGGVTAGGRRPRRS